MDGGGIWQPCVSTHMINLCVEMSDDDEKKGTTPNSLYQVNVV